MKRFLKRFAKRFIKNATLSFAFPIAYKYFARKPVAAGRVLFFETKETDMPDSFELLYQRLELDAGKHPRYMTLNQNHVLYVQYLKNSIWALHEISRAEVVFLADASDLVSCVKLRPETRVVQLWHACGAFKKWGMSTADLKFGGTRKELLRHPFYKNLSLVTVSSPDVAWAYEEAMVLQDRPEIIKPLGVSRTDVFFDQQFLANARESVESVVPQVRGKRVLLYAPTFRGRVVSAEGPDHLDIAGLKAAVGGDFVLLIKHHPFVKQLPPIPAGCEDFAFDVTRSLSIDQLLCVADVCVSDYSSLVFEYSLFGKPMAFFAYDLDNYCDWRGFYYPYEELTPGPVFRDNKLLIDWVKHVDERFDAQQVAAFRKKFMSACDGQATVRIYNEVFAPPLNEATNVKAADVLRAHDASGIDVSIVIPAHNAMPRLTRALDSLLAQTYPRERMEVLVTDDGSIDATWETLCTYQERYPALFKVERLEVASGSPAKPRNVALEKAQGKYVFFLDADDWLGSEAIERMLDHAVEWGSDVLLVKMWGENGREVPKSMFDRNQPKADIATSKICWTFAPQKLFKRNLIADMRFPNDMPEDIPFVLEAFLRAKCISVAADYAFYHLSFDPADAHASVTSWDDPHSSIRIYQRVLDLQEEFRRSDHDFAVVWKRLFNRDIPRTQSVIEHNEVVLDEGERLTMQRLKEAFASVGS